MKKILLCSLLLASGLPSDSSPADSPVKTDLATMNPDAQVEYFANERESLAGDPYRPIYHFSPPGAGLHDPAGLCWWRGNYHLFYLYSPPGLQWARGHAVSSDLVHWRDLPMLPANIRGGTGQVWADEDEVILATGDQLTTASDPMLLNWSEPLGHQFGDNYLWREGDYYYATRAKHEISTTLEILRSRDLAQWESQGLFLEDGNFTDPRTDASCNNVLPIGNGKHLVLIFSHNQGPKYYIGTADMETKRFAIEEHGQMNYGPVMRGSLHAPSGFVDPAGRCIAIWNIFESLINDDFCGTNGEVMSLPRRLSLNEQPTNGGFDRRHLNPLCIEPIEELKALRFNPVRIENVAIPANSETILPDVKGGAMELEAVIDPRQAREVGLRVLRSPDGEEQATISLFMHSWAWPWKSDRRELMIDVSQASLSPEVASRPPEVGPLYLKEGEPLRLRVFIDRSIIEVYANGRQCLTLRAYPTRPDSTGVSVFARGNEASLVSLDAYQMRSIWPEMKKKEGR